MKVVKLGPILEVKYQTSIEEIARYVREQRGITMLIIDASVAIWGGLKDRHHRTFRAAISKVKGRVGCLA